MLEEKSQLELSVVVPGHNEAENLEILIPRLAFAMKDIRYELIVVDNASTDGTRSVLERFKKSLPLIIALEPVLGYGRAVLAGLKRSRAKYVAIIRSDNQEKPEDMVRLYKACSAGGYDFCKAIRNTRSDDGLKRIVISAFFNFLFRNVFGLRSRDINATPKVFTRAFYENARLESLDWFIDAEMVIKAEHKGYKVWEEEIEYLPRLKGKSMVRATTIFEFLKNMAVWVFYKKA